ncbi:MAG TPA: hypothetical protein VL137_03530 [Polyangiaceae bacterium]|jgi:hypothetical protein|nr:hypothetical protein [Polyangiaceae bacterium]
MPQATEKKNSCMTCLGTGEAPSDFGVVDCPDCGGSGVLPNTSVLVEWRAADIERALGAGSEPAMNDVKWLLAELRRARKALTEIIALAHDASDPDSIALKIRFCANRALGLYDTSPVQPPSSGAA